MSPLSYWRLPDVVDNNWEIFVHMPLRTRAEVVAIEPLNCSEFSNTKSVTHVYCMRSTTSEEQQPDESWPSSTPSTRLPPMRWDEEVGMSYYCPAQHLHSHHNVAAGWQNSNITDLSIAQRTGLRSPPPLIAIEARR